MYVNKLQLLHSYSYQKHVYSAFFNFTKKRDKKSARFVIRSFVNRSQISQFRIAVLVGLAESA